MSLAFIDWDSPKNLTRTLKRGLQGGIRFVRLPAQSTGTPQPFPERFGKTDTSGHSRAAREHAGSATGASAQAFVQNVCMMARIALAATQKTAETIAALTPSRSPAMRWFAHLGSAMDAERTATAATGKLVLSTRHQSLRRSAMRAEAIRAKVST